MTKVTFYIDCICADDEKIHLTGSHEALGNGDVTKSIPLSCDPEKTMWKAQIDLPPNETYQYSYVIKHDNNNEIEYEKEKKVRTVKTQGKGMVVKDGDFQKTLLITEKPKNFTWIKDSAQLRIMFGHGILHDRTEAINLNDKAVKPSGIVISSVHYIKKSPNKVSYPLTNSFKEHIFVADSVELFEVEFEILAIDASNNEALIGKSFLSYGQIKKLWDLISLPVISKELTLVGSLCLEFLVILPFSHLRLFDIQSRIFSKENDHIRMGHRGTGSNKAISVSGKKTKIAENTILAFNTARQKGTNYVEFDVQLSLDKIPIIFHDFEIELPVGNTRVKAPISTLLADQFRQLHQAYQQRMNEKVSPKLRRVKSLTRMSAVEMDGGEVVSAFPEDERIHDAFPTLREVFERVPPDLGFDIEVKYPTVEQNKCAHALERNEVADHILAIVFDFSFQNRQIFFSSFDPGMCLMLSLKQPRYPVFFLTEGGFHQHLYEPRRNSLMAALDFSFYSGMHGICCRSTPLVQNPELITKIKEKGLMLFTWGPENNDRNNVEMQKQNGVDAIISDFLIKYE